MVLDCLDDSSMCGESPRGVQLTNPSRSVDFYPVR